MPAWCCPLPALIPSVDANDRRRNVGIVEWTAWFDAPEYEFARQVLQRGIATLYLVAFLSSLNQFPALLGERGLLPVPEFLARFSPLRRPTLFSWRYSDRLLRAFPGSGGPGPNPFRCTFDIHRGSWRRCIESRHGRVPA